jgi:hypothetical protein
LKSVGICWLQVIAVEAVAAAEVRTIEL